MGDARVAALAMLIVFAGLSPSEHAGTAAGTTITRHYSARADRYQYVPFDVPEGAATLRVTYQYDRAGGDNVVDLGVFEPGPLDLGTAAFRGYSGGARSGFVLSAAETTPGYRPGPLPSGRWHLMLGLYKVGANGVDVAMTVETDSGPAVAAPANPRAPAAPNAAPGWFMGALHAHTLHSDGIVTPMELVRRFRDWQFDFVAVTDHNNTTHRYELAQALAAGERPLWIVGEEVTTPGGHASVWGLTGNDWVDFRVSAGDPRIKDLVAAARRSGALFSVNHPASTCLACGWTHAVVEGIDGIEISNGRHGEVAQATALWDGLLRGGRRITGVASSDWHRDPDPMDVANVRVYAQALTTAGILEGIRGGRVIVMNDARHTTPGIIVRAGAASARIGDSLTVATGVQPVAEVRAPDMGGSRLWVIHNGTRQEAVTLDAGGRARIALPAVPGYVRFEIETAENTLLAITNPVYLVAR